MSVMYWASVVPTGVCGRRCSVSAAGSTQAVVGRDKKRERERGKKKGRECERARG